MDQPAPPPPDRSATPVNTTLSYLALAAAVRDRLHQLARTPHTEWTEDLTAQADATVDDALTALDVAAQRECIVQHFMARHAQFHPEFWAAEQNCWECQMCADLLRTQGTAPDDQPPRDSTQLAELARQCDRFGLPHDAAALVAHLEASATFRATADAGTISALQARVANHEASRSSDWEAFIADDGQPALRPTLESAYTGAQRHMANQRAELAGYKETQRELQDAFFAIAEQAKLYRQILRAMIQQSVDTENQGLTPDDPNWMTPDTFFDHLLAWTPSVMGTPLDLLRAAVSTTGFFEDDEDPAHISTAFDSGEKGITAPPSASPTDPA